MCDPIGPPPVPGAVEGGNAAGKEAGTWGRVHLTTSVTPLEKFELFPTNLNYVSYFDVFSNYFESREEIYI